MIGSELRACEKIVKIHKLDELWIALYFLNSVNSTGILASEACRVFQHSKKQSLALMQEVANRVGIEGTAALLSLPTWKVKQLLAGDRMTLWPGERKLIWLIHCLVFDPSRLRSLFDVATFGRYLPSSCGVRATRGSVRKRKRTHKTPQVTQPTTVPPVA